MSPTTDTAGAGPRPLARLDGLTAYRRKAMPACVDLRLDGNEGAWPDARLFDVLHAVGADVLRSYPSTAALEDAIAARHGTGADRVLVTAGGDEALDRVFRAFCEPGRNVVLPEPSFEMLPRYAALSGCTVREAPWHAGAFPTDLVIDLADRTTAAVFVVTPNNPTGAVASADDLRRLATALPHALLVVDHAYAEFGDADLTDVALSFPNAVVVRTLSKAWGLAGLRIGYVLGEATVVEALRKAGSPYTVPGPSLAIALAAVRDDAVAIDGFVERVRRERGELASVLRGHGFIVPDSQGNFVLARAPRSDWLWDALRGLGIAVRRFADRPALADALRITCPGDDAMLARLVAAIEAALAPDALLFDLDGALGPPESAASRVDPTTWRRWATRLPLGVVTGRSRPDAERFLDQHDLRDDCALLLCSADGPLDRNLSGIDRALEQLGGRRAWFVGTAPLDLDRARRAGVVPIGVLPATGSTAGTRAEMLDHGAARVLERTLELSDLLP